MGFSGCCNSTDTLRSLIIYYYLGLFQLHAEWGSFSCQPSTSRLEIDFDLHSQSCRISFHNLLFLLSRLKWFHHYHKWRNVRFCFLECGSMNILGIFLTGTYSMSRCTSQKYSGICSHLYLLVSKSSIWNCVSSIAFDIEINLLWVLEE